MLGREWQWHTGGSNLEELAALPSGLGASSTAVDLGESCLVVRSHSRWAAGKSRWVVEGTLSLLCRPMELERPTSALERGMSASGNHCCRRSLVLAGHQECTACCRTANARSRRRCQPCLTCCGESDGCVWVEVEEEVVDVVVVELRSARTDTFDPLPSEVRFQCDKWREEGKSKTYGLSSRHQHFSLNGCRACSAVARWRRRLFQPDFCKWPAHSSLCAVVKQKTTRALL